MKYRVTSDVTQAKRYEIPGNIGCNPGNWVFFIDSIQDIDEEYDTNDFV